jgi:signal peptidase I
MEPTLDCAKPTVGCLGTADDHVVVQLGGSVKRGDILVFKTPPEAATNCGEGGLFVKRLIGLPGEIVREDDQGLIQIDGKRLTESYISRARRGGDSAFFGQTWHVKEGTYFVIGDNRAESCDSRVWGGVPKRNVLGPVVKILHG